MAGHELKYMRAAIAVAEELNFSSAAKRLRLSQPAITKYIFELEQILGVKLFLRDRRVVSVTDAGRAYVEYARIAMFNADRAVQAARTAGHNATIVLNLGRSPYADPYLISTLLTLRLPLFPSLHLNFVSGFSYDLVRDVLSGELDAAVVIEPPESGKLTGLKLELSPFYVVMSRTDQHAALPALKINHLAGRRWVMFQRSIHPPLYDAFQRCAQQTKTIPSAIQHFMVPEEAAPLLIDPASVVIVGKAGALRIARDGYTMRPLEEEELMMNTVLISRSDNASAVLSELFRGLVRRMQLAKPQDQMSLPISS